MVRRAETTWSRPCDECEATGTIHAVARLDSEETSYSESFRCIKCESMWEADSTDVPVCFTEAVALESGMWSLYLEASDAALRPYAQRLMSTLGVDQRSAVSLARQGSGDTPVAVGIRAFVEHLCDEFVDVGGRARVVKDSTDAGPR